MVGLVTNKNDNIMEIRIKADSDRHGEVDVRFTNDTLNNDNFVEMEVGWYDDPLTFSIDDLAAVVAAFRELWKSIEKYVKRLKITIWKNGFLKIGIVCWSV